MPNPDLLDLLDIPHSDVQDIIRLASHPSIRGVEVTQAVQYYRSDRHLTDAADRQADNSVRLVAGKPAWVRVYIRGGLGIGSISGVTGTIVVRRRSGGFLWGTVATLAPRAPGSVTAYSVLNYAAERGSLAYTLNFVIPADMMCGNLRLDVTVTAPSGATATRQVYLDVTLRQTLRLAGIMVGYNGPASSAAGAPNITRAAPGLADLQSTSAWTLKTFPVRSAATYRTAGTLTWNQPLTDPPTGPGACSPNWVALNTAIQATRVADGNRTDVLYYGLMASGIPTGPVIGCNTGGVSTGSANDGITMAHELGHACGRPHSPCGTPGDPGYPAYEPYDPPGTPTASIGEYGLDIDTGAVLPPATFKDFMSYCGPSWVSPFVYGRLTDNAALDPVRVCVDLPWWKDIILQERVLIPEKWLPDPPPEDPWREIRVTPQPVISLIGVLAGPDQLEIRSVFRLEAESTIAHGRRLDLRAELIGRDGVVVAAGDLYALESRAAGCGGCAGGGCGGGCAGDDVYPKLIQAFVPDVEEGAALRVQRGGESLWVRQRSARRPVVREVAAELRDDQLHLRWASEVGSDAPPECWVQWSPDRGQTWHALAAGLVGDSATIDARALPPGRVSLRLLVSDGFSTARSRVVALTVPRRPPEATILSPREQQTVLAGSPLRLWAVASDARSEPLPDDAARWLMDGKEIAVGLDVFVDTLPDEGDHKVTLVIRTREGEVERTVTVRTVALAEERDID